MVPPLLQPQRHFRIVGNEAALVVPGNLKGNIHGEFQKSIIRHMDIFMNMGQVVANDL